MIRLNEIKLSIDSDEIELYKIACTMLHIQRSEIKELVIYKKSIDARDKSNIHFVYTLDLDIFNQSRFKSRVIKNVDKYSRVEVKRTSTQRPVIIGTGPSRTFCCFNFIRSRFESYNNRTR